MSKKVVKLDTVQHKYDIEECAGCEEKITGKFHEIGLPSVDGSEVKHIALCNKCYQSALDHGVIFN